MEIEIIFDVIKRVRHADFYFGNNKVTFQSTEQKSV